MSDENVEHFDCSKNGNCLIFGAIVFSLILSVSLPIGIFSRAEHSPDLIFDFNTPSPTPEITTAPPVFTIPDDIYTTPAPSPSSNSFQEDTFATKAWNELAPIDDFEHSPSSISMSEVNNNGYRLAVGIRKFNQDTGLVRVYDLEENVDGDYSWQEKVSVTGERQGDQFGQTVSISSNGSTLVVGAPGYDKVQGSDANEGRIYIYDLDSMPNISRSHANAEKTMGKTITGEITAEQFGYVCALHRSGETLVVGSPYYDGIGAVRVFEKSDQNGNWNPVGDTVVGTGADDFFGGAISISENRMQLVVGAPRDRSSLQKGGYIKIFELRPILNTFTWTETGFINPLKTTRDAFGTSICQSSDGALLFIGSPAYAQNRGIARLFKKDDGFWTEIGHYSGNMPQDMLGSTVQMSVDASKFAVATSHSRQVAIFKQDSSSKEGWVTSPLINSEEDGFGRLISMLEDGTFIAVASSGTVRSYYRNL